MSSLRWSSGSPSSLTYPPSGIAETRRSVSPHLKPASRGPKPKEKMKTRIPNAFAVMKCPNSWKKIMSPSTATKAAVFVRMSMVRF